MSSIQNHQSVIEILLKAGGQDQVEALRKSVANYQALLEELPRQLNAGKLTAEEFAQQAASLGREHDKQARILGQMEASLEAEARATRDAASAAQQATAAAAQQEAQARKTAAALWEVATASREEVEAAHAAAIAARDAAAAEARWEDVLQSVEVQARQTAAAHRGLSTSVDASAKTAAAWGRTVLDSGRLVQDFTQGGFAGIVNNIEGISTSIGTAVGASAATVSVLAGAFTIVGTAAFIAAPYVKSWVTEIVAGANAVPPLTDKLGRLEEEYKTSTKRLEELRGQQSLTNAQLAEHNRLTTEATALEKQLNDEKKRKQDLEKVTQSTSDEQQDRGQAFTKAIAGRGDETISAVEKALAVEGERLIAAEKARIDRELNKLARTATPDEYNDAAIKAYEGLDTFTKTTRQSAKASAEALVIRATKGDERAVKRIDDLAAGGSGGAMLQDVSQKTYEGSKQGKLDKDLTEQGRENEQAMRDAEAKAREDETKRLNAEAAKNEQAGKDKEQAARDKEQAAREKGEAKDDNADRKRFNANVDATAARAGQGSLDEAAAAAAAQYRAQGGIMGRNGRVQQADESEQLRALMEDLVPRLRQMMPNLNQTQANAVAARMATRSFDQVDAARQDRAGELAVPAMQGARTAAERTAALTAANQQATAEVLQATHATLARVEQLEANQGQLIQAARGVRTRSMQRRSR